MTRTAARSSLFVAATAAVAIVGFAPAPAAAQSYDIDCKLILCLAGGFPSGCQDALSHMMKRLRRGKSPIDFCAMSDGKEYDAYNIDYKVIPATQSKGWECPAGKNLYHNTESENEGTFRHNVNTFCYDRSYSYGNGTRNRYTNKTPPTRLDFAVNLTVEPGSPAAYSQGWKQFHTGLAGDHAINIRYSE